MKLYSLKLVDAFGTEVTVHGWNGDPVYMQSLMQGKKHVILPLAAADERAPWRVEISEVQWTEVPA